MVLPLLLTDYHNQADIQRGRNTINWGDRRDIAPKYNLMELLEVIDIFDPSRSNGGGKAVTVDALVDTHVRRSLVDTHVGRSMTLACDTLQYRHSLLILTLCMHPCALMLVLLIAQSTIYLVTRLGEKKQATSILRAFSPKL